MKLSKKESLAMRRLLERAEYKTRSYSGRGMYGKNCLGVYTEDSIAKFVANIAIELLNDPEYYYEEFDSNISPSDIMEFVGKYVCGDSLGMEHVYYFPKIEFVETDDEFSES